MIYHAIFAFLMRNLFFLNPAVPPAGIKSFVEEDLFKIQRKSWTILDDFGVLSIKIREKIMI